jgi:adenylate cyclase
VAELKLETYLPGMPGESFTADRSPFTLGRQNSCDFVLPVMGVSRQHARLLENPSGWHVEDLGGKNGTFLNGRPVMGSQPLHTGDTLTLGNVHIKVVSGGIEKRTPAPEESEAIDSSTGKTMITKEVRSLREDWLGLDEKAPERADETEIIARLNDLLEISNLLNLALSLEEIIVKVKDAVFRHLMTVERLALLVDLEGSGNLEMRSCFLRSGSGESVTTDGNWVSRSICQRAYDEEVAIQTSDAQSDKRFEGAHSIIDKGIRSAMAVPLWSEAKVVGVLYADARHSTFQMAGSQTQELGFFSALANIVASSIQRWNLTEKLASESKNRERLERYHSPAVVNHLLTSEVIQSDRINPRDYEISIMMCDLVGFTRLSESLSPNETAEMLNLFFDHMLEEIFNEGGTLDKFLGDGIMAFFGAPDIQQDHAERAVRAGEGMLRRLNHLNSDNTFSSQLAVRIGINSGRAVVGDVGSSKRVDYTALGSSVNLASRLEGICPPDSLMISESTLHRLSSRQGWQDLGEVNLKGISRSVRVFNRKPI